MNTCDCCDTRSMQDVNMYAGETIPWTVSVKHDNGSATAYTDMQNVTATLTFIPYAVTYGTSDYAIATAPVLTIDGDIQSDDDGSCLVVFEFSKNDTINMRGKYIYQIEIEDAGAVCINQGYVTIRQNINRGSSNGV